MGDPRALLNDSEETFRIAMEGQQSNLWTALPGIIIDVNLEDNTCSVQPAIQGSVEDVDGNVSFVNLPNLIKVPICFPKAGGFMLTLPVNAGDEVLVVFSSRCIDGWWQQGGIQKAVEFRMHDLSDGFALLAPSSVPNAITGISSTEAQLRNADGDTFLSIAPGGIIKLTAPGGVTVTGDINVTGHIVASGEITGNGIPLSTHIHPQSGGGNTGAPIP